MSYSDPAFKPRCDGCQYLTKPHIEASVLTCPCSCHLIDAIEMLKAKQVCRGLWAFRGTGDYNEPVWHIVNTRVLNEAGVTGVYEFSMQEILDTLPGDLTTDEVTEIVSLANWNREEVK